MLIAFEKPLFVFHAVVIDVQIFGRPVSTVSSIYQNVKICRASTGKSVLQIPCSPYCQPDTIANLPLHAFPARSFGLASPHTAACLRTLAELV